MREGEMKAHHVENEEGERWVPQVLLRMRNFTSHCDLWISELSVEPETRKWCGSRKWMKAQAKQVTCSVNITWRMTKNQRGKDTATKSIWTQVIVDVRGNLRLKPPMNSIVLSLYFLSGHSFTFKTISPLHLINCPHNFMLCSQTKTCFT